MLVALLIGAGIFAFGVYYTINTRSKIDEYIEASAYVIGYEKKYDDDGVLYSEIVEYYVGDERYTAQNSMSSNAPQRIGSEMQIAYNPANPSECIFVGSENLLYIFLFVFGGALMAFGIFMAFHLKKTF